MPHDANSIDPSQPDFDDLPWAPSAGRNATPISKVLREWLPVKGRVLELASGTGQHIVRFASEYPGLHWQPSDPDESQCMSVIERTRRSGLANIAQALQMPAESDWPEGPWDIVLAVNLVHIAPWRVTESILKSAAAGLAENGALLFYGPYHRGGKPTSQGNESFDASLRSQNTGSGIRHLEALIEAARAQGLSRVDIVDMPANNLFVRLRK